MGLQEITEENCIDFSRLGNNLCGNQREQEPKIPKEKDEEAIGDILLHIELNRNIYCYCN